jgi:serine/threonine-protein kinase HipA
MGKLSVQQVKGRKAFSFSYHQEWINSQEQHLIDPDITWFTGQQFPNRKENFGVFLDSMPDSWGRNLMRRRAALYARDQKRPIPVLTDIDYLLGVHDFCRMGALRFKSDPEGDFLDNDPVSPAPPWTTIRELQHSAEWLESGMDTPEAQKWLAVLVAPGSSLGGARPKANIMDQDSHLWIAKFPSKNDTYNKGAWEYLAYRLALQAGIMMAESRIEKVSGNYDTFFTRRFDRDKNQRIHFASAMTMTGKNEELIRDTTPSYLDIAEFIQFSCAHSEEDLRQLWKRIVFNILISNTDDHLRNHGFLLTREGWRLAPAYDVNPSVDKVGHALNIDMENNSSDLLLAKSTAPWFRLGDKELNHILDEVKTAVSSWRKIAGQMGISKQEQALMAPAFKVY